jgi:hypothetical protein
MIKHIGNSLKTEMKLPSENQFLIKNSFLLWKRLYFGWVCALVVKSCFLSL